MMNTLLIYHSFTASETNNPDVERLSRMSDVSKHLTYILASPDAT